MFRIFKKEKFPIKTFIFVSIFNFLLLFFVLAVLKTILFPARQSSQNEVANDYYLNTEYKDRDPLITSVPTLKDMITGPIIDGNDPSLGAENGQVVITEFADFECSYCLKQEKIIRELLEEYSGKIKLIWKDFPDVKISSPSFQASIAGRCAGKQGKFWEYHDLLFSHGNYNKDLFIELANNLGLKIDDFGACLQNEGVIRSINDNILEADALEITGVPFLYINDKEIMGEVDKEELKNIIDKELEMIK